MNFPEFKKKTNDSPANLSHIILDNSSSGGIIQMYFDHYKRFENKPVKK
jgi:hypothetical protein